MKLKCLLLVAAVFSGGCAAHHDHCHDIACPDLHHVKHFCHDRRCKGTIHGFACHAVDLHLRLTPGCVFELVHAAVWVTIAICHEIFPCEACREEFVEVQVRNGE